MRRDEKACTVVWRSADGDGVAGVVWREEGMYRWCVLFYNRGPFPLSLGTGSTRATAQAISRCRAAMSEVRARLEGG